MNIEQIKEQITCLNYLGKPLRKTSAGWFLYRCPWREDNHPSLNVTPNTNIAREFLQEAHYSFMPRDDGKFLYALAYSNDKDGYELRSEFYKGGTSPKGITTHLDHGNASTVVFEGFFDMLSFATLCGEVRHNYIVLNSIINTPVAIEVLRSMGGKVYLCLDNDEGGEKATRQMLDLLPSAIDTRNRFAPAKDVNEYLISTFEGKKVLSH